jgi:hypothetical protein
MLAHYRVISHWLARFALCVVCVATMATPARAQTLVARYTPVANFAYQLDCIAQLLQSCAGRNDYSALWRNTFGIDPSASNEVKRWRALRIEHERAVQPRFELVEPGWPFSMVDPRSRALAAGLGARDIADYQSRLALLMHDSISAEAAMIVATLYRPFERWWNAAALPPGHAKAQELVARINRDDMRAEFRTLNAFYGDPPGARREASIHLMFRPGLADRNNTSGQNIGVDSFAEFFADEDIAHRIPVIAHEYAHFVFGTTPIAQAKTLRSAIQRAGGDIGGPAWSLLNEALATALGNGRVQRMLISPKAFEQYAKEDNSFYSDPLIDGAGKALLPILDKMATQGATIHGAEFSRLYVDALKARFGAKLNSPAAHLNEMLIVIDASFNSARMLETWSKHIRSYSRWDYSAVCCGKEFLANLNAQPGVARVTLIPTASLEQAQFLSGAARASLTEQSLRSGAALFVIRNSGEPPLIVVALARHDDATVERALAALAKATELREGAIAIETANQ